MVRQTVTASYHLQKAEQLRNLSRAQKSTGRKENKCIQRLGFLLVRGNAALILKGAAQKT
jgi:hypothetical protein